MQVYNKSNSIGIKTFLLFLAVLAIAYLPVSSFSFFIKNDAFNGYFPPRFFMSESLRSGYLPLWNPYINFGFPQYGDMSSGYWSPVTWLIAGTSGYNAYIFTLEILLYLLLGGLGMYRLVNYFTQNHITATICGLSFLCCGFNIGHLQHVNWISGMALLTWCTYYYLLLQQKSHKYQVLSAALVFYIFLSSAHPTLVIAAFYFFIILFFFGFFKNELHPGWRISWQRYLVKILVLAVLIGMLSLAMILGYLDIIPHFVRGEKIDLATSLENFVPLRSWASTLLPLSVNKDPGLLTTDPSVRNHYVGLATLLFLLVGTWQQKTRWQWCWLLTGLFFLLLSTGGIFKTLAYHTFPFMAYVRLNGIYTGIASLCFILFAATTLNRYINNKLAPLRSFKTGCMILGSLLLMATLFGIIKAVAGNSFLHDLPAIREAASPLKALIDAITYYDTLWLQGFVQLILLALLYISIRLRRHDWLKWVVITDLVLSALLNLPYTGVGQASVADVQRVLNQSPAGIIVPPLQPINANDTGTAYRNGLTGHWSMYGKQPGVTREVAYPITLKTTKHYLQTIKNQPGSGFMNQPLLFPMRAQLTDGLVLTGYTGNSISFNYRATQADTLLFQQNNYPYWKYDDGSEKNVLQKDHFMAVPVKQGSNSIKIFFNPLFIRSAMIVSLLSFLGILIGFFVLKRGRKS